MGNPAGLRIQVVGPSCAGKTTLAAILAERLGLEFLELDALFWKPGWVEPPAEEFAETLARATAGERWVAAGNYTRHTMPLYWESLDTVVWLDFPMRTVVPRILRRSWRRWRAGEVLWGTNAERFWPQLKLWDTKDSLIAYTVRRNGVQRGQFLAAMGDPTLDRIRWVLLKSPGQVERWLETLAV